MCHRLQSYVRQADPLGFGAARKKVDEVYGFGATPVFHNSELETPNEVRR